MRSAKTSKDIFDETARVEAVSTVAKGHYRLKLRCRPITRKARPGQFVNILCGGATLLRRPLSIHRVERPDLRPADLRTGRAGSRQKRVGDCFEVLFKVVGPGTRRLAELEPGDELSVLGPLGKGFQVPKVIRRAVLVGGGCGSAPLYALAEDLRLRGVETLAFIGAADEATLPVVVSKRAAPLPFRATNRRACLTASDLESIGVKTALATMSGRKGYRGPVTDILELFLDAHDALGAGTVVFASGPWAMLRKVAELTECHGVRCQVLLEEMMGCGIGACMSCVVKVRLPNGEIAQKRVCVDGPMFDASKVCWDAR